MKRMGMNYDWDDKLGRMSWKKRKPIQLPPLPRLLKNNNQSKIQEDFIGTMQTSEGVEARPSTLPGKDIVESRTPAQLPPPPPLSGPFWTY